MPVPRTLPRNRRKTPTETEDEVGVLLCQEAAKASCLPTAGPAARSKRVALPLLRPSRCPRRSASRSPLGRAPAVSPPTPECRFRWRLRKSWPVGRSLLQRTGAATSAARPTCPQQDESSTPRGGDRFPRIRQSRDSRHRRPSRADPHQRADLLSSRAGRRQTSDWPHSAPCFAGSAGKRAARPA
jgi:hypothetical protein